MEYFSSPHPIVSAQIERKLHKPKISCHSQGAYIPLSHPCSTGIRVRYRQLKSEILSKATLPLSTNAVKWKQPFCLLPFQASSLGCLLWVRCLRDWCVWSFNTAGSWSGSIRVLQLNYWTSYPILKDLQPATGWKNSISVLFCKGIICFQGACSCVHYMHLHKGVWVMHETKIVFYLQNGKKCSSLWVLVWFGFFLWNWLDTKIRRN